MAGFSCTTSINDWASRSQSSLKANGTIGHEKDSSAQAAAGANAMMFTFPEYAGASGYTRANMHLDLDLDTDPDDPVSYSETTLLYRNMKCKH